MLIKKVLYYSFLIIFALLVNITYVDAEEVELSSECTAQEKFRLRELVNNTRITYELKSYEDVEGNPYKKYDVSISGFNEEFYVFWQRRGILIEYSGDDIVSHFGFDPGETYQFPFYASDNNICSGYHILTKNVYFPPYNIYSEDSLCEGHEDYELCKKHSPIIIDSYEEFVQRMNQYLNNLENQDEDNSLVEDSSPEDSLWNRVINFLIKYNLYILISIIVIGIITIVIISIKKRRKIL
jgi:hypothetical protein